jgi:ribonuclease D
MLKYAALDVEILIDLRNALAAQLQEQGKDEWARQEFAAIAAAPPSAPRPDPWRRTSGIHRVRSRRGLAVIRELWAARDEIAQEADVSPRRVLADTAIIEAARTLPVSRHDLERISGFTARAARRNAAAWLAAVQRARDLAEADLPEVTGAGTSGGPPPPHRWSERYPEAAARLTAAREVVTTLSAEHSVPAENLISPDYVRRLSWEPPPGAEDGSVEAAATIATALRGYGARPWQAGLLAAPIAAAWQQLATQQDQPTQDQATPDQATHGTDTAARDA